MKISSPRKNYISRGHRPKEILIFLRGIVVFIPESSCNNFYYVEHLFFSQNTCTSNSISFPTFRKQLYRKCLILYFIFSVFLIE